MILIERKTSVISGSSDSAEGLFTLKNLHSHQMSPGLLIPVFSGLNILFFIL